MNATRSALWTQVNDTLASGDWRGITRSDLETLATAAARGDVTDKLATPDGLPAFVADRVRAVNAAIDGFQARRG